MAVSQKYEKDVQFELRALSTMQGTGEEKDPKFTRDGYGFKEWYSYDSDGNKHTYTDQMSVTFTTEEMNLSADWNLCSYTITYENILESENPVENPRNYTIETPTITFASGVRNGYDCSWSPIGIAKGNFGNKTTTANWTPITYTIDYLGLETGDVNPESNPKTYTIETTGINYSPAIRTGYTCTWNPTGFSTGSTGNLSTTASWTINKYTVSFEQPESEGSIRLFFADGSQEKYSGDEIEYKTNLSVYVQENEGYEVNSIKVNGTDITSGRTFSMPAENASIIVTWNDIQGIVYFYPGY